MKEKNFCPQCNSKHCYQDANLWVCPECFHEWTVLEESNPSTTPSFIDVNGNNLENGDTVALVKDLSLGKEKLKAGTKAKNIRLLEEPVDGHDIACKIAGHGSIYLKCSVVKKVK
jgi:protein PhnA